MSQADWNLSGSSLGSGSVVVVETAAFPVAPGAADNFAQLMNSTTTAIGVVAYFHNGVGFAPTTAGGLMQGCIKKGISAGTAGWSPFLMACLQGTGTVADEAYILGFANTNPARLVLRKGALTGGLPDVAPPANPGDPLVQGVIARSEDVFAVDEWVHLRLMVRVNGNLDAVITCERNDLSLHAANAPVWQAIPGIDQIVDDGAGALTGTPAFQLGRWGYGAWFGDTQRRAMFDELYIEAD